MKTIPHQKVKMLILIFLGIIILSFIGFHVFMAIKTDKNKAKSSSAPISELAPYSILTPPTWLYKKTAKNTEFAYDIDSAGLRVKIGDNEYLVKTNTDGSVDIYKINKDGSLTKVDDAKTKGMVNSAALDVALNGNDEGVKSLLKNNIPELSKNVSGSSFTDGELQKIIDMVNASTPSSLTLDDVKNRLANGEKLADILNGAASKEPTSWLDNFLSGSGITAEDFQKFLDTNNLTPEEFQKMMETNGIKNYSEFKDLKDKAYPSYKNGNSDLTSRALSNKNISSSIVPNPPDKNLLAQKEKNKEDPLTGLTPIAYNPSSSLTSSGNMDTALKNLATSSSSYEAQNKQKEKTDFLTAGTNAKIEGKFLTSNDIAVGTVIPCILINGINTDLPGYIIAQTTQNIYDSKNHTNLLIPKGTRLFAQYDSAVTFGQSRVLVTFSSLSRPDGYYTNLPSFAGTDELGFAGYEGNVNNHIASILGAGVLSSLIDIGFGIATSQIQDTTARAITNALTDNTQKTADKYLDKIINKQPTIKIAPGTNVSILVNKNLTLPDVKQQRSLI